MRFSLLIFGLLIPNLLVAQAPKKIIGTGVYTLARSSANARAEEVSFVPGKEVIRITIANKPATFSPEEVALFTIGQRKFLALNDIITTEKKSVIPAHIFAEQLDSGQIVLLHYWREDIDYGVGMGGTTHNFMSFYLLRKANESVYTVIKDREIGSKKQTQRLLAPYLTGRPDLAKLVESNVPGRVLADNVLPIIHALNTGQPYAFPLTHYELMKQAATQKTQRAAMASDSVKH